MDGSLSSTATGRARAAEVDFLAAPLAGDIVRSGGEFVVGRPWAMARIEGQSLRGGWWTLECEGEGHCSGVEVRVSSPRDPLVIFPGMTSKAYRVFLPDFDHYDVALLVSPWPGRFSFSKLRLRHLSAGEEMRFLMNGVGRLMRSRDPFTVAARLAQRLFAGQSLGVNVASPAPVHSSVATPDTNLQSARPGRALPIRIEHSNGIEAVLGGEDQLHPRAFEVVAAEFARSAEVQAVYADAREGGAITPHPAFDPVLAGATDYVGLPVFFRAPGQPGPEDAWKRLSAIAEKSGPGAVGRIALPLTERPAASPPPIPAIPQPVLDPAPRVSLVIPTKIRVDLLEKCLEGLRLHTGYPDMEVVVVDNGCDDPRFWDVLGTAKAALNLVLVEDHGDFNFSRLVNEGVRRSTGEVVVLFNDDVVPTESGWLHRMVESALMPGVGAVGARLVYPDGSIQHAGVMLGLGGVAGHLWKGTPRAEADRNPYIACPSSRLAVTGACLAVRRSVFEQAGGLDEAAFPVAFNDIDFCLRLNAKGLRTVYRGDAVLVHHEGQSRGQDDESIAKRRRLATETKKFLDRWKAMIWNDPYGSPAFDPLCESGAVHRSLQAGGP